MARQGATVQAPMTSIVVRARSTIKSRVPWRSSTRGSCPLAIAVETVARSALGCQVELLKGQYSMRDAQLFHAQCSMVTHQALGIEQWRFFSVSGVILPIQVNFAD